MLNFLALVFHEGKICIANNYIFLLQPERCCVVFVKEKFTKISKWPREIFLLSTRKSVFVFHSRRILLQVLSLTFLRFR